MKLTINLNDPTERDNAIAIIGMFDQPEPAQDTEEVTYLPEDSPEVEALEEKVEAASPAEVVEPEPETQAEPEFPKAGAAAVETKLDVPDLAVTQELAKSLLKSETASLSQIRSLLGEFGVQKVQDLSDEDRVAFHAKCVGMQGDANV